MQIEILKTETALNEIENEWNTLLKQSANHVPFLRHEYLSTWWSTLGGGEWENGDLFVATARDENGSLRGIAPLFFTPNRDGKPALMFLGSIEISDYLDLIASPEDLPAFTGALLEYLTGSEGGDWQVLDLYNFLEESSTLPFLEQTASQFGLTYTQEKIQPAPHIQLPATWDEYLAGIQKKQRHEIRRKIRRAEGLEEGVSWYFVTDEAQLDQAMDDFMALMAYDHHKDEFLTDVMRSQMKKAVHSAFRAGWLQLAFLEIGGVKAAGYLNFDFDNRIWVYNSGINFDLGKLSPGWVLLGYLIEWAIENGRETFDFMRGDEIYKYRLGGVDRHVLRVQIQRNA